MWRTLAAALVAAVGGVVSAQAPATLPPPVFAELPPVVSPPPPGGAMTTLTAPTPSPVTYAPGDGLTVSMMNGQSKAKLFGSFSAIGVFSTTRPFAAGLPLFLLPPSPFGLNTNTFDLHARQTSFGAAFTGPEVMGFTPGAFFVGFIQNDSLTNDAYGLLPYNAYGELKNDDWRIAAGLMNDVFNPASPTIISLGKLFGSGNTGSFRGQVRAERYFKPGEALQLTAQAALSEPVSSVLQSNQRILEDNGWPNVEARLAAGVGSVLELAGGRKLRPVEVGVSGTVGQLRTSRLITAPTDPDLNRAVVTTWGLGADAQLALTERFGVAAEFFVGQGLGEYNGGVLQSFNAGFRPIRATGGWGEVYYYLTDQLHIHTGYGLDAPTRGDLDPTQIARNQTYFTNLVWDASKVLQFSFQVDYRKTDYIAFPNAEGVVFVSQMLWRF
jgi:hypothetical protein